MGTKDAKTVGCMTTALLQQLHNLIGQALVLFPQRSPINHGYLIEELLRFIKDPAIETDKKIRSMGYDYPGYLLCFHELVVRILQLFPELERSDEEFDKFFGALQYFKEAPKKVLDYPDRFDLPDVLECTPKLYFSDNNEKNVGFVSVTAAFNKYILSATQTVSNLLDRTTSSAQLCGQGGYVIDAVNELATYPGVEVVWKDPSVFCGYISAMFDRSHRDPAGCYPLKYNFNNQNAFLVRGVAGLIYLVTIVWLEKSEIWEIDAAEDFENHILHMHDHIFSATPYVKAA